MPLQRRYLEAHIQDDLDRRMAFVGGPRQVGKTMLACYEPCLATTRFPS